MPRPLPVQSCLKSGCKKPNLRLFNNNVHPQQSTMMRHSTILQSPQQRRLGCGSSGKVPIGYDTEGNPIRNEKGEIIYIQGCNKTQEGTQYTELRKINAFGRYANQSGGIHHPQKGGLVVRNF